MSKKSKRALTRGDFLRAAGVGAAGASLLGAAGCGGLAGQGAAAAGRVPARRGAGPNVILVIIDSLRRDHVGAYGNPWIQHPHPRRHRRGEPAVHARPTRGDAHPAGQARHLHGDEDLADQPAPLRVVFDPLGAAHAGRDPRGEGYNTYLVTDTYVQFPENFGRGFGLYRTDPGPGEGSLQGPVLGRRRGDARTLPDPRRGQEGPPVPGQRPGSQGRRRLLRPQGVLRRHAGAGEAVGENRPFFLVADCYDPHEPWDPPEEYVALYDEGYNGQGTPRRQLRQGRLPHRPPTPQDEGGLRRRGHHDGPLAREVHREGARARGHGEDPARGA